MSGEVRAMDSKVVSQFFVSVVAIYLVMNGMNTRVLGQDSPVKTVASKSDATESPTIDEKHPLFTLLQISYKSQKLLESVDDYECLFLKQELIGKKIYKSKMNLKYRESPQSIYLKFIDANAGREVIYVQGQNNNNFLVHEAGLRAVLGTFELSPTSPDALAENKYPVTTIGLKHMLNLVIKQWESEAKFGGVTTKKYEKSKSPTGELCTVYEAAHTQPFKEFKFHTTRLWIDDDTGYAIGLQQYAFPNKNDKEPPLAEEYFYLKIKMNAKLADADFNKRNPNYAFK